MKFLFKLLVFSIVILGVAYFYVSKSYKGETPVRIYVPANADKAALRDTLTERLGTEYGLKVYFTWLAMQGEIDKTHGSYVVEPGMSALDIANRMAKGRQTPVKVVLNVARTESDVASAIASNLEATPDDIINAIDSVLAQRTDYPSAATYPAAILPDTYEFYWTDTPGHVVDVLVGYTDKFWNDSRMAQLRALGLTAVEATTLASIVEEESNKTDEQPVIARLYLNRLMKGMPLQADPTVKFAVGDFSLRRITANHLNVNSPYNTYKFKGLPPGPIRVPQKSTIDAVLNSPSNTYLYMCAKDDFSGYHNFAVDYETHLQNAKKYAEALDRRGIN